MSRALPHRLPIVVLTLGLALATVACGGSSSGGSGDTSATSVEETTTTTIPTPASAGVTCQTASAALGRVSDSVLGQDPGAVDLETLNIRLGNTINLYRECQTALRATIPTLPAAAQGPATAYADSIDPVLAELQNPPTATTTAAWLDTLTVVVDAMAVARQNLAAADPAFGL
ncbi:MAG: hypothetical protein KGR18_07050 [Acidobacteria bacterium]|nr:hypothetical protein [Acidobacteriota bacterium]